MQKTVLTSFTTFLFLLAFILLSGSGAAQSARELDTRLQNGRILLEQQKFELAMSEILPVISASSNYKNIPQALYLYSVAAVQAKKYKEATERLSQLQTQYTNWPNLHEARYLQANIAFELREYAKALQTLNSITAPVLTADKAAMTQVFVSRITNKTLLAGLVQQFPDDAVLAQVYADKLISGWYTEKDKVTLDNIVSKFNLDRQKYTPRILASQKKGHYNVALLLPFPAGISSSELKAHKDFIDLYTGIQMAKDSLARQNITINLFSYDAPKDTNKVKAVLALPEMTAMDLIIGPVYKTANKIISRFATQHQIVTINPLSEDIDLVKNNPYLYLFQSSTRTRARKTADFAYDTFSPKTAIIVYSNSEEGIEYAQAYKAAFEKRGGKILASRGISPTGSAGGLYSGLNVGAAGHIMAASNHNGVAYNTISMLERMPSKIPVVTFASWLDMSQFSIKQLNDQEMYFMHPDYVDTSLPHVRAFRRQYLNRFHIPPATKSMGNQVYTGFDLMYYFGNTLSRHGSQFKASLASEGAISGAFYQGIGFGSEHDNQYVPILKLENLQLNVVNPVF